MQARGGWDTVAACKELCSEYHRGSKKWKVSARGGGLGRRNRSLPDVRTNWFTGA